MKAQKEMVTKKGVQYWTMQISHFLAHITKTGDD
jgi:hypothetical protein